MNKKLGRLLWPGLWVFFTAMVGFTVAAAIMENYILAAVEGGLTAMLYAWAEEDFQSTPENLVHSVLFLVPQEFQTEGGAL